MAGAGERRNGTLRERRDVVMWDGGVGREGGGRDGVRE